MLPATGPGHYLRDIVYGALDGGVTTLAIVAGAAGANLGARIAIVLGLANLVADGLSMAAGNFLGIKSAELQAGRDPRIEKPLRHGLATLAAFVAVGSVPLLAFLMPVGAPLAWAAAMTGAVLFAVGAARSRFLPGRNSWALGFEMMGIAVLAGGAALGVGYLAKSLL